MEGTLSTSIEFKDPEVLKAWLNKQAHASCSAIAARAAIRVLPLAFRFLEAAEDEIQDKKRIALAACRAAFMSWAANVYAREKEYDSILRGTRAAAGEATKFTNISAPELSAALAAAAAAAADPSVVTTVENVAYIQKTSAVFAARACDLAATVADSSIVWASVGADANWIMNSSGEPLIQQPLWLIDVKGNQSFEVNFPLWAREPFDAFDKSNWVKQGPWGVWLVWYRAILAHADNRQDVDVFGARSQIEIATKDNEFWIRDPDLVTADIAGIAGWEWPHPPQSQAATSVAPQTDAPTRDDRLGRRPFAQAMVERMDRIFEEGGNDGGFAAHIHAPWGAGKTSVLLMMSDLMTDKDRKSTDGKSAPRWVVVQFNAWEHERRNPPWWPLIEKVKGQCFERLSGTQHGWIEICTGCLKRLRRAGAISQRQDHEQAALLQARWIWWRLTTDALPYLLAAAVGAICLWVLWAGPTLDWPLKLFTAALAAYAAFFSASRVAVFGSDTAAKFYESISQDPLQRITGLFAQIVEKTNRPVCVFIDDLDRCRAEYVVDLLEGIQTSFRHKNVAYIVAADRSWLKASFEARYGAFFASAVGNVGQPLGYLFLEKIFQVSTPIPGMGTTTRATYWSQLLKPTLVRQRAGQPATGDDYLLSSHDAKKEFDSNVESKRADLRVRHGDHLTRDEAEVIVSKSDTAEDRAAVILELNASRAAEKEAKHLLEQFTGLLPDNPRVMKRMINAFAMRQTIDMLEHGTIPSGLLARWTILEQRYPALADLLIPNPEWMLMLAEKVDDKVREHLPSPLLPFVNSEIIRSIIGEAEEDRLTVEHVRAITRGSAS
jgi:KAP family P-loop domain